MQRLRAILRRPICWLTVAFFIVWIGVLRTQIPPMPKYIVHTEVNESDEPDKTIRSFFRKYVVACDVADDGTQVLVELKENALRYTVHHGPQVWDMRTGQGVTKLRTGGIGLENIIFEMNMFFRPCNRF